MEKVGRGTLIKAGVLGAAATAVADQPEYFTVRSTVGALFEIVQV